MDVVTRKSFAWRFQQTLERINFSAVSDAALVFGLLGLAELAIAGQGNLATLKPHPFWIPVLYVTVKHGSRAGLGTAAAATLLLLLFVGPERLPDQDFYSYSLRAHIDPAMWLIAALILGSFIDRYHAEKNELQSGARTALSQRDDIAGYCRQLSSRLSAVERANLTRPDDAVDVAMTAFANLQSASQEQSAEAVQQLATALFGPCVVAEHVVDPTIGKVLESKLIVRSASFVETTANDIGDDVVHQLLSASDCLSVLHEEGSEADGPFVFACPLRDSSSVCRSIVCLQEIAPNKIAPWAEFAFKRMAQEIATARYPAAARNRSTSDRRVSDASDGIATWH